MTPSDRSAAVREQRPTVVVVGGGMAGLAAALEIGADPDVEVVLLEAAEELGGALRADELSGSLAGTPIDVGAESVLATRPEALGLARQIGLGSRVVYPEKLVNGLYVDGRMRDLPRGLVVGIPADLRSLAASEVLPLPDLMRLPMDRVRGATDGLADAEDMSIGELVAARLGPEVVSRLVEPMVCSVYAGRAEDLSLDMAVPTLARVMRRERSLLAAAKEVNSARVAGTPRGRPAFAGLRGGLAQIVPAALDQLAEQGVRVKTSTPVRSLARRGRRWVLDLDGPTRQLHADAVILAVPAPVAGQLLRPVLPFASSTLNRVRYASTGIVTIAVPRNSPAVRPLTGRYTGFLAGPTAGLAVNQVTVTTQKWAWMHAAFPDHVVVRASIGRVGAEEVLELDDADLAALVASDIGRAFGVPEVAVDGFVVHRWPASLPQYEPGYRARMASVNEQVAAIGGLALCGAAYDGVGLAACVASGRSAARQVRGQVADLVFAAEA